MISFEVDPWMKKNIHATQAYKVSGPLFTIPFVNSNDLTFTRSRGKYLDECRRLPSHFLPYNEEKGLPLLQKPQRLEEPINFTKNEKRVYLHESSSQHMTTILDGIEESAVKFDNPDFLVTAETLNKISGAVSHQERGWKLRAFVEEIRGKKMIVLCDDDLDDEPTVPQQAFQTERLESAGFSQEICERQSEDRIINPYLHGCLAVQSTITTDVNTVRMVVFGKVDILVEDQPAISCVMTGIGRSDRADFGEKEANPYYEYIWFRSFWLGLGTCLLGLRGEDGEEVKVIQRMNLTQFYGQQRCRNDKEADVATSCVARVLVRLREAILSNPRSNWIVEFEGRDEHLEPDNIKIFEAESSFSFWLIREKFHLQKIEKIEKLYNRVKKDEALKVRKFTQKHTGFKIKIRKRTGSIARQFRKFIRIT